MKNDVFFPTFSTRSKLSKRKGAQEILEYRTRGIYPESIVNLLTQAGGGFTSGTISQTSRLHHIDELIEDFDVSLINRNSCQLNVPKLDDYNRQSLKGRLQSPTEKTAFIADARKMVQEKYATDAAESVVVQVVDWALQSRLANINDLFTPDMAFVWTRKSSADSAILGLDEKLLTAVAKAMEELPDDAFHRTEIAKRLRSVAGENGMDFKALMKVLRLVVSGTARGPSVAEMAEILGRTEFTARVKDALPRQQKEAVISGWVSENVIGFFSRHIFFFFCPVTKWSQLFPSVFFHEYFPVIRSIINTKKKWKKEDVSGTHTDTMATSVRNMSFPLFPLQITSKRENQPDAISTKSFQGAVCCRRFFIFCVSKKSVHFFLRFFPLDCDFFFFLRFFPLDCDFFLWIACDGTKKPGHLCHVVFLLFPNVLAHWSKSIFFFVSLGDRQSAGLTKMLSMMENLCGVSLVLSALLLCGLGLANTTPTPHLEGPASVQPANASQSAEIQDPLYPYKKWNRTSVPYYLDSNFSTWQITHLNHSLFH